jgi:hypothetical protein
MIALEIALAVLGGAFVLLVWALFGVLTFGGKEVIRVKHKMEKDCKKGGGKKK